jgi:hypothetical protein
MKRQFVVTHTIQQTEIHTLLDSWVTNAPSVKMLGPQKIAGPYIFVKKQIMLKCQSIDDQSSVSLSRKSAYRRVMTNCCFMGYVRPVCLEFHCFCATL